MNSRKLWSELRDARHCWPRRPSALVWRLSVPPAAGAEVGARLAARSSAPKPITTGAAA